MGWGIVAAVIGGALLGNKGTKKPKERKMGEAEKTVMDTATSGYAGAVAQQKKLINPLLDSTKKDVTSLLTSQARGASANFINDNISRAKTPFDVANIYAKTNENLTSAANTATSLARGNKFARGINAVSMGKGFGASSTNSLMSLTDIANQRSRIEQNNSLNDMARQGTAFRKLAGLAGDRFSGALSGGGIDLGAADSMQFGDRGA
ncbi:MAG: hypothetical protein GY776_07120 [Alteromonas sp.]|nr:hypothetical protein [Alteromonas sp.]